MKEQIRGLLKKGKSYSEIVAQVGCSKATVAYYAKQLGLSHGRLQYYDWAAISSYYEAGHSIDDCIERFGFSRGAWDGAVRHVVVGHL